MKRLNFLFVELLLASITMFACDSVKTGNSDEQIELALKYIKEDSTNIDKGIGLLTDLQMMEMRMPNIYWEKFSLQVIM